MSSLWYITLCCVFLGAITNVKGQIQNRQSIGFPEPEEDTSLSNKDNRQPVFIPAMCPTDELLYPGDQKDDWICDCRPAYLYHPKSDKCWPAYRRGPCEAGSYLVLKTESAIPVCEKNPCTTDGTVTYNGRCERLGDFGPCRHLWPIAAAVAVNSTTISIACERINFQSRFAELPAKLSSALCPPGCKRSINGKCVIVNP